MGKGVRRVALLRISRAEWNVTRPVEEGEGLSVRESRTVFLSEPGEQEVGPAVRIGCVCVRIQLTELKVT